jgi:hypothetical protein
MNVVDEKKDRATKKIPSTGAFEAARATRTDFEIRAIPGKMQKLCG